MSTLHIIMAALMLPMLLLSAACSGAETALFGLTQSDRVRLRKSHPRVHAAVAVLLSHPGELLVTILLSNVSVNTLLMVCGTLIAAAFPPAGAAAVGVVVVFALIIFGEIVPKALAALHRERALLAIALPLKWWMLLLGPVRTVSTRFLIAPLVRVLHPPERQAFSLTTSDLSALLTVGAAQGVLDEEEQTLLDDVVGLSALRVREVMTPRVDLRWLRGEDSARELLELVGRSGRSKFPLYDGDVDTPTVLGVVRVQRVLPMLNAGRSPESIHLREVADPVRFVPDRARLDQVLDQFRVSGSDIAMCVSETGEVTGLVTLDDMVRQLVGGARGESVSPHQEVRVRELGVWEVSGRLPLRDWRDYFEPGEFDLPGHVSTVAGLILFKLGHVPKMGDEVSVGGLHLRVESMTGRVISLVSVRLREARDGGAA
jgi:putative hemolysin